MFYSEPSFARADLGIERGAHVVFAKTLLIVQHYTQVGGYRNGRQIDVYPQGRWKLVGPPLHSSQRTKIYPHERWELVWSLLSSPLAFKCNPKNDVNW